MIWRLLKKLGLHGHHQNLNERPGDDWVRPSGSILVHGRAWLDLWGLASLCWSWNLWSRFCDLEVSVSSEDGITVHIAFPPVSLWFSLNLKWFRNFHYRYDWYRLGMSVHHATLWVTLWAYDVESRGGDPFWSKYRRRFCWNPVDFFLGRSKYSERVLSTESVIIPMSEANYEGTAERFLSTWKRPRWPFARTMVRVKVEMKDPIPVPGKGENSWDCGEDAIYGQTTPAQTIPEAVGSLVESVLRTRGKYGGRNWKPEVLREAG